MSYRHVPILLPAIVLIALHATQVNAQALEPPTQNQFNRAQDLRRIDRTWVKPSGRYAWRELIRLELREQELHFSLVAAAAHGPLRSGRKVAVEIAGSEAVWEVTTEGRTWLDSGRTIPSNHFTAVAHFDRGASEDRWHAKLLRNTPENLMLLGFGTISGQKLEMQFVSHPRQRVHLQAFRVDEGQRRVVADLSAGDLLSLLEAHPAEVRAFLAPVLTQVCGQNPLAPRAADVYAAFPQLEPDSEMIEKVEAVLPQMDSPDPRQRSAASRSLQALGAPAVLVVMHMDRSDLSDEQRTRLEHFLAQHRTPGVDPQQARRDVPFLIECLAHGHDAVRTAAREELEQLLDQPISIDDDASPDQRAARLMSIYREKHSPK
jgi:hypothetical protein